MFFSEWTPRLKGKEDERRRRKKNHSNFTFGYEIWHPNSRLRYKATILLRSQSDSIGMNYGAAKSLNLQQRKKKKKTKQEGKKRATQSYSKGRTENNGRHVV